MKKKYVIFDMDGVLFDSERLIQRCWRQVGEQQGLADIGETFLQCVGTTRGTPGGCSRPGTRSAPMTGSRRPAAACSSGPLRKPVCP